MQDAVDVRSVEKWADTSYVAQEMLDDLGEETVTALLVRSALASCARQGWTPISGTESVRFLTRTDQTFVFNDALLDLPAGMVVAVTTVRCYPNTHPN